MKRTRSRRASGKPIRGGRIILRVPRAPDGREFCALMRRNRRFFRGLVTAFNGRKDFAEYLERCGHEDYFSFLICRREDGRLIGKISLFNIVRRSVQNACLGYLIDRAHGRQGYATEALQLILSYAFRQVRLHRVEADIQPHNTASIALVRRAGFHCEGLSRRYVRIGGRWRDHERWALLVEDWRRRRSS